jgi:hypothetical protein
VGLFLCKNGVPSPSINKRGQSQNHLLLKKKFTKLWNKSDIFLYLQLISIRIAGTIRDFRITKFAQKDGLLAAFLGFFLLKIHWFFSNLGILTQKINCNSTAYWVFTL